MKKIELKVEGMMCVGCENRIKNTLLQIKGIKEVVASHQNKEVEIICDENLTEEIIREKIENLGFDVI